ncbi:MAG: 16S rRNA (uracil(1498)-N(3))-methyltransferase [Deltaproteobacteria bacterium]|nr:16S rRNA (uracil(1498)-N(3))-methyltransferase [Deltaproteobacteria bacterium]
MRRFYVPVLHVEKDLLKISGQEARHIQRVLRLRTGDGIVVFDGSGREYEGVIVGEEPTAVVIKVRTIFSSKEESPIEIVLAQSLLKGEKMDYLIQKATELGVRKIIPFFSSRSVPRPDRAKTLERHQRLERIAVEASKQCGRGMITRIEPLCDYSEMLSLASRESLRIVLDEREGRRLKEVLRESKDQRRIFFVVGPEGGMSQEEIEKSKKTGFIPVFMGRRIMRAETASLCLLSILQYEWGDIG